MALGEPKNLPDKYVSALSRYIKEGMEPGGFVSACLKNDLFDAVGKADQFSLAIIDNLIGWLCKHAPATCWGSEENFKAWLEKGGMSIWNINYDTNDVPA